MAYARQVCVDRLEHGVKQNKKKSATPPSHLHTEEAPGFIATFGSKPIRLVGQVDPVWGDGGESPGNEESRNCADDNYNADQKKEGEFGLPAIRPTVSVEVRSHDIWQLWINVDALQNSE